MHRARIQLVALALVQETDLVQRFLAHAAILPRRTGWTGPCPSTSDARQISRSRNVRLPSSSTGDSGMAARITTARQTHTPTTGVTNWQATGKGTSRLFRCSMQTAGGCCDSGSIRHLSRWLLRSDVRSGQEQWRRFPSLSSDVTVDQGMVALRGSSGHPLTGTF